MRASDFNNAAPQKKPRQMAEPDFAPNPHSPISAAEEQP
jgi:hypothetical protein